MHILAIFLIEKRARENEIQNIMCVFTQSLKHEYDITRGHFSEF